MKIERTAKDIFRISLGMIFTRFSLTLYTYIVQFFIKTDRNQLEKALVSG